MSVEIRQLKDKHTGEAFVPVTHWDAIAGKPGLDMIDPLTESNFTQIFKFGENHIDYYIDYIYIDDFNDPSNWEDRGYDTLLEYVDDIINDPQLAISYGTNVYVPTLKLITYDGEIYDVWKLFVGSGRLNKDLGEYDGGYGFMPQNITYDELYNMSLEANINLKSCPFVAVFYGSLQYAGTEELYSGYTLIHVHKIDHILNDLPSQSNFDKLYIDNFYDYGLYPVMYRYGVNNILDYIDEVIDNEGDEYYYDTGETITYDGETCRIFMDNLDYGGFVPIDKTFSELYEDSLEADSYNITKFTTPFIATCDPDREVNYEGRQCLHKHSTLIAVR